MDINKENFLNILKRINFIKRRWEIFFKF
jgi:hypothetical protein